jgi:4-oxalocrotonate tautomerase
MPFINVKVAGQKLAQGQVERIQAGITTLMTDILHKVGPLVGVLVEEVALAGWSVGAAPLAGEKGRFIAEASRLLKDVLGSQFAEVSYVVIHEVPKDSWGYGGLTQAHRAQNR